MSDGRPLIGIIRAHKDPRIPGNEADTGKCPNCAGETEDGFGHAGGGYGPYTFCASCGMVVTKTEENQEPEKRRRLIWFQLFDHLAIAAVVVVIALGAIVHAVTR